MRETAPAIGFIGLGVMGGSMCRNVVQLHAGPVCAFDMNPAALEEIRLAGGLVAASVADVAAGADVIFLSLPGGKQVAEVCAAIAAAAIAAGADLVNDVEGGRFGAHGDESPMGAACAAARCPLILMHRRREANYREFWPEMLGDLRASLHAARSAGMAPEQLWTDPGFGFGKSPAQNLMLVRDLAKVAALGYPVLLGTSRKSTLGLVLDEPDPLRRGPGNDVTAAWGIAQGCSMLRVHDVAAIRPVVRMADALRQAPRPA